MAATITSTTQNPIRVGSSNALVPYGNVDVSDPFLSGPGGISGGGGGFLTITLRSDLGPLGTISDPITRLPVIPVVYDAPTNTSTFYAKTYGGPQSAGANAFPNQILDRLVYTAPPLPDGVTKMIYSSVSFTPGGSGDPASPPPSPSDPATVTASDAVVFDVRGAPLPLPPPVVTLDPVPPVVAPPVTPPVPVAVPANFGITNSTTGASSFVAGTAYAGPVEGLARELIVITPDNLAVASTIPNVFIHTGSGTDAINVWGGGGNNVLDGGTGSNYLVGGTGRDTFFLDARGDMSKPIWNTVRNLGSGDAATLWGVTPQDFALSWQDNQGAAGATGLTLHATRAGGATASLTLSGYATNDLTNGRLALNFGDNAGGKYLYVAAI